MEILTFLYFPEHVFTAHNSLNRRVPNGTYNDAGMQTSQITDSLLTDFEVLQLF
jgi:hypothetical protein